MLAGEAGSKLKVLTWRHISLLPSQAHVFVLVSLIPFSTHLHPRTSHTELTFALRARNLTVILFSMWTILSFLWGIVTKYSSVWNRASDFPPPGGRDCGQLPSQSLYLNLKMTWTENQTLLTGGASHWKDSVSRRDHGGFLQDERSTFYLRVAASVGAAPGKRLKGAVCRFGRRNSDLRTISGR